MPTFVKAEPQEWEKLEPAKPARAKSKWDDALAILESSEEGLKVYFADDKEKKGSRIALGRFAKERGLETTARFGEDEKGTFFILKKTGKHDSSDTPKTRRSRKN